MLKAITFFSLLLLPIVASINTSANASAEPSSLKTTPSPEFVIRQEITLNVLIANLHLLQLDFQNSDAREKLQESLILLDNSLKQLQTYKGDQETQELISNTKVLWPVVKKHAEWIVRLSEARKAPNTHSLQLALVKLDRQLLLLQQKLTIRDPYSKPSLAFLEQALLMQRLSREYLSLTLDSRQKDIVASGQAQLQTLINHFDQKLIRLDKQLDHYPQGAKSFRKVQITWGYIKEGMMTFPEQSIPELIARHSNQVVSRLTSVYQLF
ncbi:hypothetical protein EOPP23_03740 [Endozoicomonas sp. OPT23]|uniref:hypothetical protein n=1 Tax=Endozoicomonas sp. OPT23 TaxID=2072845 RepID=UPI00129AD772|nr:hypothetical protein [Endozoicomonas sp. OPT23]MRI32106.1 hypothetical protein [Endozoicomonas sp. OPT23]